LTNSGSSDAKAPAVVLLSGGLDSCVTAAIAARDHELFCLHADYGQRTQERERRAAIAIAAHYGAPLRQLDMSHIVVPGSSNLTDLETDPETGDLERDSMPATYVPFRNANLLAAAVSWAEAIKAERVYIGVVEEDSSGYPDCRESFIQAFQGAVLAGTATENCITITTPLLHLKKQDIVQLGIELAAPIEHTWSCYFDSTLACGKCDSCLLRLRGFREAGFSDPLPYREY
jgi:7-cyano-7-deazaguanine synthase